MMLKVIEEANNFFQQYALEHRLTLDLSLTNEDMYDVYMAKKNNGKPKDDYPRKKILTLS